MILLLLIVLPLAGGLLAWLCERFGAAWPRWISLLALAADLALAASLWPGQGGSGEAWIAQAAWPWIPRFGIGLHLGMDGLSLILILLTGFLGIMAVMSSWTEIESRVGLFHFNLLWCLAGVVGVFLALDLFLFFFFWELMLVPMYFIIAIWGHENRVYAALKFFIFTQGSGLLMLVAILALALLNYRATGLLSFDYFDLLGARLEPTAAVWIMLGFFAAFAVKLPAVPLHTWLPDAHTEAPTAGSIILAGLLLKTGAYGLLRFVVPLFPDAAQAFAPVAMALGVAGILYGAILAFAQTDLKRLVAYTSVSHLGFVLVGVFAWNQLALQGAVMQMVAHGISTGALFMLVGALQERIHTRDIGRMGGLWAVAPRMGAIGLFFAIASLGLPGLGNFVGEFLVLLGAFRVNPALTATAAAGLVAAAIYALFLVQRVFHGENGEGWKMADFSFRETAAMAALMAPIVALGFYPQPMFDTAAPALDTLQQYARGEQP
ncbi:MAG: NADH-quinone oxidoreductase subunit M [Sulfuricella sp.]|nr:NADH-quinone oxidoreductase subunit M [Sulfuricella sp.]